MKDPGDATSYKTVQSEGSKRKKVTPAKKDPAFREAVVVGAKSQQKK